MDEFGSEHHRHAEPVATRESRSAWSDWSRDEWAFRIVTAVAVVESLVLIVDGRLAFGSPGSSTGTIVVDSQPAAAEVRIDGNVAGTTPLSVTAEKDHGPSKSVTSRCRGSGRSRSRAAKPASSLVQFVTPPATGADAASEIRITSEPAQALGLDRRRRSAVDTAGRCRS